MSDYAELVKRLRLFGDIEAADAIKALVQERDALRAQVNGWQRMMDEALNTGDGSYRP